MEPRQRGLEEGGREVGREEGGVRTSAARVLAPCFGGLIIPPGHWDGEGDGVALGILHRRRCLGQPEGGREGGSEGGRVNIPHIIIF